QPDRVRKSPASPACRLLHRLHPVLQRADLLDRAGDDVAGGEIARRPHDVVALVADAAELRIAGPAGAAGRAGADPHARAQGEDGVAEAVVERVLDWDMAPRLADDDGKLDLVVELLRHPAIPQDRLPGTDDAGRRLQEEFRLLALQRRFRLLLVVVDIVAAGAQ